MIGEGFAINIEVKGKIYINIPESINTINLFYLGSGLIMKGYLPQKDRLTFIRTRSLFQ